MVIAYLMKASFYIHKSYIITPNVAVGETGKKPAVLGGSITFKIPSLGIEMGGSIGREAVLGGAVLGGTTVHHTL